MPFSRSEINQRKITPILDTNTTTDNDSQPVEYLFVINSDVVTSNKTGPESYRLNVPVSQSDELLLAFSDSPNRIARKLTAQQTVALWNRNQPGNVFANDPPNAVLSYRDPNTQQRGATVVTISGAELTQDGRTMHLFVTERGFSQIDNDIYQGILPVMSGASLFVDHATRREVNLWHVTPAPPPPRNEAV